MWSTATSRSRRLNATTVWPYVMWGARISLCDRPNCMRLTKRQPWRYVGGVLRSFDRRTIRLCLDDFSQSNPRMGNRPLAALASCRDRGWMWGRVGALCLSSWHHDSVRFLEAEGSWPNEDRHKAPSSTPPLPLSLQMGSERFRGLSVSGVHVHQDLSPCLFITNRLIRKGGTRVCQLESKPTC